MESRGVGMIYPLQTQLNCFENEITKAEIERYVN